MADTPIPVGLGSVAAGGRETQAGTGTRNRGDVTTEWARKSAMRDAGDATTVLRRAVDKAWRLAHTPQDVNTVYRDAVE